MIYRPRVVYDTILYILHSTLDFNSSWAFLINDEETPHYRRPYTYIRGCMYNWLIHNLCTGCVSTPSRKTGKFSIKIPIITYPGLEKFRESSLSKVSLWKKCIFLIFDLDHYCHDPLLYVYRNYVCLLLEYKSSPFWISLEKLGGWNLRHTSKLLVLNPLYGSA
jgi:hypothetical protein